MPVPRLIEFFENVGEKPYRARQVMRWMYQRHETDFAAMTDLSAALRKQLAQMTTLALPPVLKREHSDDGTRKWLLDVGAGQAVETVYIPEPNRGTLCISSQAGCALDCAFCATGHQGFNRNLSSAEIMSQVVLASREVAPASVTNVVFMGMGEPLANYRNVLPVVQLLIDDQAYGLSRRRVTISTAGVVPQIHKLAGDCNVALAVSLHAPTDELRDRLVPVNRKYPLAELLAACRRYPGASNARRITFEYVMLRGVNDSEAEARELVRLIRGIPAKVNLIPFNPWPGAPYRTSTYEQTAKFAAIVNAAGYSSPIRRPRGRDILAACGQLKTESERARRAAPDGGQRKAVA